MRVWGAVRSLPGRLTWWGSALVGVAAVIVLAAPVASRFGGSQQPFYGWYTTADGSLLTGLILDQVQYTRLTDATAGRAPSSEIAPFTSRALAPWLAGRLSLDAPIALLIVNVGSLVLGTFALALLAMDLTRHRQATFVAVAVWAFSFPVFRYVGSGFVDPAAVGLVPCVLLTLWRRWLVPGLLLLWAAIWMKETSFVVLPVAVAFEWLRPGATRSTRLLRAGAWLAVAVAAFVTAAVPGGEHLIVFAPWVPRSLVTAERMLLFNIGTPARIIAYGLTVLPAVFAVVMWRRGGERSRPVLPEPVAIPLVIGCAAGAALGLFALPTALWDGRTVWMTLPMAALLIAGWVAAGDGAADMQDVRRFARSAVLPLIGCAVLWLGFVALAPKPVGPAVLDASYRPRFTAPPSQPEDTTTRTVAGSGKQPIELAGSTPLLVEFDSSRPISLSSGDQPLLRAGRATRGVALFDPADGRTLDVSADGRWTLLIRPVSSGIFWEAVSPLNGEGPNVLVFPGGLPRPMHVSWSSDDPDDRIDLVGGCRLGACGQLPRSGVIPAGTEALVVDAAGPWGLVPGFPASGDEPLLKGTDASG